MDNLSKKLNASAVFLLNCFSISHLRWTLELWSRLKHNQVLSHCGGWKIYPEVKAPEVGYISCNNLLSPPSLMRLRQMIAFSCSASLSEVKQKPSHFFLTKTHRELRKLSLSHTSVVWQRTEQTLLFQGVGGGLWWWCWGMSAFCVGIICVFYSCFLRVAS